MRWPPPATREPSSGLPATSARGPRSGSCSASAASSWWGRSCRSDSPAPRRSPMTCAASRRPSRCSRRRARATSARSSCSRTRSASPTGCCMPARSARTRRRGWTRRDSACSWRTCTARPNAAANGDSSRRSTPTSAPTSRRRERSPSCSRRWTPACSDCASTPATARSAAAIRSASCEARAPSSTTFTSRTSISTCSRACTPRAGDSRTPGPRACSASSERAARTSTSASASSYAAATTGGSWSNRIACSDRAVVHRRARGGGAQPRVASRARPLTRSTRTSGSRRRPRSRSRTAPSRSDGRTRPCARGRCPAASRR